jgi:ATP-dependent helicase IRC3
VLAHRDELLEQAFTKICQADSNLRVDIEQGSRTASPSADVIVASVPSLGRMGSDRLSRFSPDDFKCIVIDEAHHSPSPTYIRILDHFHTLNSSDKPRSHVLVWGCSATLRRHDGIRLSDVFEEVSYYKTILDLWEDGWLCPAKAFRVLTNIDISDVSKTGSDFSLSQLAAKVNTSSRNSAIVHAWKQHVDHDPRYSTLVFAVNVEHVQNLTAMFRNKGIEAHHVDGNTPKDERFDLLERFKQRDYPVLVNCQVFTEGTDIPGVDCIVMARPTASPVLFQQMLGRGLRLHPDKQDCIILDCVDVCQKRGVVTLPSLLGLAPHFNMKGVSAFEVYKRMKELVDIEADCLVSESLVEAEKISTEGLDIGVRLKEIPQWAGESSPVSRKYAWVKLSGGCFGLQLIKAGELLIFKKSDKDYEIYLKSKETESAKRYNKIKDKHCNSFVLLGSFDCLQSAFNGANTYITSHSHFFARLAEHKAEWRSKPATQRQIELVNKLYCNRLHNTGMFMYVIQFV